MKTNLEFGTTSHDEPQLRPAGPAWFCVRSHLKHEHIAAAHLALIPEVEVFNPRLRLLRSTRRGRVWSTEPLFPNYVFARFVLEGKLEKVRYTPSVTTVLHFGTHVPAIPDAVIESLRRDLDELKDQVLTDAPEEGEEVEVGNGAFKGLTGQVIRVLPARQRVEILLDFMGRSVAAELSLDLLVFRRREAARLALPEALAYGGVRRKFPGPARLAPALSADVRSSSRLETAAV
jgi:transcriptional antiterminator RfaH